MPVRTIICCEIGGIQIVVKSIIIEFLNEGIINPVLQFMELVPKSGQSYLTRNSRGPILA